MTVILKSGPRFSANNVQITNAPTLDESNHMAGEHSVVTFLCSGRLNTYGATEVKTIEYREGGSVHCEACDQRVDRPEDYPPREPLVAAGTHRVDAGVAQVPGPGR
jgi:hypothetical protein